MFRALAPVCKDPVTVNCHKEMHGDHEGQWRVGEGVTTPVWHKARLIAVAEWYAVNGASAVDTPGAGAER